MVETDKLDSRIILLHGEINDELHTQVARNILELDSISNAPIYMHINSEGGSTYEMLSILDLMRNCKSDIITISTGKCMSAAVPILAAGKKGERKAGKYTSFMIHQISTGLYGKLFEIENDSSHAKHLQKIYFEALSEATGVSLQKFSKIYNLNKDCYMTANEAKNFKIFDKIF